MEVRETAWHCERTMKDKLIIVVDLGLVRAYRIDLTPQKTRRLELVQEIVLEEAHTRLKDRVTDLAGRHRGSTQKNRSAPMADDHNLKLEEKRRLILNELPPAVRKRIEKSVPCDFTKLSPPEVLEHFLDRVLR
jgi:hypothetical protein